MGRFGIGVTLLGIVAIGGILLADTAMAADVVGVATDNVLSAFQQNTSKWQASLASHANKLFWLLATLQFSYAMIRLAMKGGDFGDFAAEIISQILFIGFFDALLINGPAWAKAIVTSFLQAGAEASQAAGGSGSLTPAKVVQDAVTVVQKLWSQMGLFKVGTDIELCLVGIVVLLTMGLIAAQMVEALVESYIVISAGTLLLGFGGSMWTKEFALKILNYVMSVGAKLFVLELIVALGMQFVDGYTTNVPSSAGGFAEMCIVLIILLMVAKSIPNMCQSLMNGSSFSTGGSALSAAAAFAGMAVAAAAGAAAAGNAAAGSSAAADARDNLKAAGSAVGDAATGKTSFGAAARNITQQLGQAGLNFAQAGREGVSTGMGTVAKATAVDLGRRLSGQARHGTMGGRMGVDMVKDMLKPAPPATPGEGSGGGGTGAGTGEESGKISA